MLTTPIRKGVIGNASCAVLDGVECVGDREFITQDWPCVKYSGKQFPTAVLLSLLLGMFGIDRLYLGCVLEFQIH